MVKYNSYKEKKRHLLISLTENSYYLFTIIKLDLKNRYHLLGTEKVAAEQMFSKML